MSRLTARTRRLRNALKEAAEVAGTTFTRPDGSTLTIPGGLAVDIFLDIMGSKPVERLSPQAVAFLAGVDVKGSMSDVEASLIALAKDALAELQTPANVKHLLDLDRATTPTLTLPQTIQVDDPNSPEGES